MNGSKVIQLKLDASACLYSGSTFRQNMDSCTEQEHVSRFALDTAIFKWKIENFSTEKLRDNEDEFIESPPYKYSGINWTLRLSRSSEGIYLILSPRQTNDVPQIFTCKFKFHSREKKFYERKFTEPLNVTNLKTLLSEKNLLADCVDDGVLTVSCELTSKELIDFQPKTSPTATEKEKCFEGYSTLAENFGSILDCGKFSDITLKTGKETFRAHKAILASRSKVFEGMFDSGMRENREGVVEIMDMKPSTAKEMLRYFYTGKVEKLSVARAMDLYAAADRYDLQELREWCRAVLVQSTAADEVCDLAVLADLHDDEELAKVAKDVFKLECETILATQAWREFAKDNPSVYMDLVESTLINKS